MRNKLEKQPGVSDESLISQAKAAEMCGMTRAAIHDLVRRRRFRSVEVAGRDLVYFKEVVLYAREQDKLDAHGNAEPIFEDEITLVKS